MSLWERLKRRPQQLPNNDLLDAPMHMAHLRVTPAALVLLHRQLEELRPTVAELGVDLVELPEHPSTILSFWAMGHIGWHIIYGRVAPDGSRRSYTLDTWATRADAMNTLTAIALRIRKERSERNAG